MTPSNIVNMAKLKELDIIAISDHQSVGNVASAQKVARGLGIILLPALEVESAEEVHLLCLFSELAGAMELEKSVRSNMANIENRPEIFGDQLYYDEDEGVIGEEKLLLLQACSLSIEQIYEQCEALGGICIPAHVDRDSYSIISNLGMLPPYPKFPTVEISKSGGDFPLPPDVRIISNSDAHYLQDINEAVNFLELETLSKTEVIKLLKNFQ